MALLDAFEDSQYPNDIGPGVYDIHSPNVPDVDWMVQLMHKAAARLPRERLRVNPGCGLKTRGWPETQAALESMVEAARVTACQRLSAWQRRAGAEWAPPHAGHRRKLYFKGFSCCMLRVPENTGRAP